MRPPSTLERAFELARSGRFNNVSDLTRQLKTERHEAVEGHMSGSLVRRQLAALIKEAKERPGLRPQDEG